MPPHETYIESHLGGGAVMRHKRPAAVQIGIDKDPNVIARWVHMPDLCDVVQGDAVDLLQHLNPDRGAVVYADPPYMPETRRRTKVYRHDYTTEDHERLLACLKALSCRVLLSGYYSQLYADALDGWSVHRFNARTHAENREECVWFNFPKPATLHDDRYIGSNFREREVIRRRLSRLQSRIGGLSKAEQASLYRWLGTSIDRGGAT